ncbi:MAG: dihydrofolate reductase [Candidatus Promineifilaceae bacterium]|nr:dihydrofolate reductase [Candidatus Promineifilaceae bacterium]
MSIFSIIVAMDKNGLIGANNRVPWRLPDDMKYFRQKTMGKPVIMGRKTYESIPDRFRPLKGRKNIILTHQANYRAPGCIVTHSVLEAIKAAAGAEEVMIIGGAEIYRQFLPRADRIYLTKIDGEFEGDVSFPQENWSKWVEVEKDEHPVDDRHDHPFSFLTLERWRNSMPGDQEQTKILSS